MSDPVKRHKILNRIRQNSENIHLPDVQSGFPDLPDRTSTGPGEMAERFVSELELLNVTCFREDSEEAVVSRVRELIENKIVFAWKPEQLPYGIGALLKDDCTAHTREDRETAQIGLTGCDAAIAETGTLALIAGNGKSRAASLLPFTHIAVVRKADILFSMGEFFEKTGMRLAESSCLNFITGPSRTADIELQLILGVHGPGRLIVILGP